ncbi:MAG: thiamine biosynthesis lipoprotein [Salibacteraceae bacterium]|jgi:thiamine biosynthesis lipoprotein
MILEVKSTNILKEKLHRWGFSFLVLLLVSSGQSCKDEEHSQFPQLRYEIMGEAQGTTYNIVYFTEEIIIHKSQVDSILDEIDMAASVWVDSSVISQINNLNDTVFDLSDQPNSYFLDNFLLCKEVYENTGGAYNPTVGQLVNAWGFGFKNRQNMDSVLVDSLLQSVGFDSKDMMVLEESKYSTVLKKRNPTTQLDYNGVAQGYSVDVLGTYFKSKGVGHFMIEVGGELLANGRKSDGSFWKIGIDEPLTANLERTLVATIELNNMAVATSGNYRKFYESDGVKYAHTINPLTGFPVQHSLLSVTVVMPNCGLADAYATSFMVMGFKEAKELILLKPQLGIEAYFIYENASGKLETYLTPGLRQIITEL